MLKIKSDWYFKWIEISDEEDKVYRSRLRLKDGAPDDIKAAFKKFMRITNNNDRRMYKTKRAEENHESSP